MQKKSLFLLFNGLTYWFNCWAFLLSRTVPWCRSSRTTADSGSSAAAPGTVSPPTTCATVSPSAGTGGTRTRSSVGPRFLLKPHRESYPGTVDSTRLIIDRFDQLIIRSGRGWTHLWTRPCSSTAADSRSPASRNRTSSDLRARTWCIHQICTGTSRLEPYPNVLLF